MTTTNKLLIALIALLIIGAAYYFIHSASEKKARRDAYFLKITLDLQREIAAKQIELHGKVDDSTQRELDSLEVEWMKYKSDH